ncbi:hypothetical protein R1sor_020120 [Riccia sorocarpa]|uniref:Uncharacterized protein n=1 Tax=Riccia sorocarpa TaxID=122646 RepID=A0ABD3IEE5_9MARC
MVRTRGLGVLPPSSTLPPPARQSRHECPRASDLLPRPSDPGPSDPPSRRSGARSSDLPPRPSDPGPSDPSSRRSDRRSSDPPPHHSDPGPSDPSSRRSDRRSSDPPPHRSDPGPSNPPPRRSSPDSVPERSAIPRRPRQSHRASSSTEVPSDMLATVREGIRPLFDGAEGERRAFLADELERFIVGTIERIQASQPTSSSHGRVLRESVDTAPALSSRRRSCSPDRDRRRRRRSHSPRRDRRDGRDGRDRQPRLHVKLGRAGFTDDPYRGTLTSIILQLCMLHHPDLHLTISHLTTEEQYRLFTDIRSRFTRCEELSEKELRNTVRQHFRDRKYGRLRKLKAMLSELDYDTDPNASLEKPIWISETSWVVMLLDAQQCFWQSEMDRMEKALIHTREDEAAGRETLRTVSYLETR